MAHPPSHVTHAPVAPLTTHALSHNAAQLAPRHPLPQHAARKQLCVAATALSRRFYPLNRGIEVLPAAFTQNALQTFMCPFGLCYTGLVALPKPTCPTR